MFVGVGAAVTGYLLLFALLTPSIALAQNYDEPVNAFLFKQLPWHLEKPTKLGAEFDVRGAELAVYYLLGSLDANRPIDSDFKRALKYYCEVSNECANTALDPEPLLKDIPLLKHQLEISLPGQRYQRFPRITWADDRKSILLRYPQPEVYGLSQSVKKITSESTTYWSYHKELCECNISPGQELVLISHRFRRNPLDFERVDFEKSYNQLMYASAKRKGILKRTHEMPHKN